MRGRCPGGHRASQSNKCRTLLVLRPFHLGNRLRPGLDQIGFGVTVQEGGNSWDTLPEVGDEAGDEFDPTQARRATPPPMLDTRAPPVEARPTKSPVKEPPPLPSSINAPPPLRSRISRAAPPRASGAPAPELDATQIRDFLLTTPLFDDPKVAKGAADRAEVQKFSAGAVIIRAGTPADGIGFVVRGRVTLASAESLTGTTTVVQTLNPRDHFGEESALTGTPYPLEVAAAEPSVVVRLNAEVVELLMSRAAGFAPALAKRLAARVLQQGFSVRSAAPIFEERSGIHFPPDDVGLRFVQVSDYNPTAEVIAMIPQKLIVQHRMIPLKLGAKALTVGMPNPNNAAAISEVKRYLHSVALDVVAISIEDYADALLRFRLQGGGGPVRQDVISPESLQFDVLDSEREAEKAVRVVGDEVVRAVSRVIALGIQKEASDVHIESTAKGVSVKFRINGHLEPMKEMLPLGYAAGFVTRMKILAGLDITERRLPQEGRIGITIGRREVDMRLSTIPASRGEKIVLRIFEEASMTRALDRVFVDKNVLEAVRNALSRNSGALLIAGGTGSGKSTTLYSTLSERKKVLPDSNILMVEDPIEYRLQGITQIQVNPAVKLGFAEVLRAMLRQDPDVIAIGETRDGKTAAIALEAAMTGHLLLTTVHATDTLSAIQRLEGLGCSRELMAQSVSIFIGQRLSRRLCPKCSRTEVAAPMLQEGLVAKGLAEKGTRPKLPRAVGCEECDQTGYVGRVPVVETLAVDDAVRDALIAGRPLTEVGRVGIESGAFLPYRRYAATLMERGLISAVDALMAVAG